MCCKFFAAVFFFFFSAHCWLKVWRVRSCWCTCAVIAQRRLQASSKSLSVMLECYKYLSGMLFARIFTFRHKYHICGSSTVTCACNFSRQSVSVQFSDSERFHLSLVKVTMPCSSCRHSTQVNFRLQCFDARRFLQFLPLISEARQLRTEWIRYILTRSAVAVCSSWTLQYAYLATQTAQHWNAQHWQGCTVSGQWALAYRLRPKERRRWAGTRQG